MTATTTLPVLFATGIHSARPAASAVGAGGLYSCTTHSLVYQTDGVSTWSTWATLGGTASGSITASGYTQSTAKLLGRSTASTGAIEEITVGSGLTLSAGSLTASGGGGTPAAAGTLVQSIAWATIASGGTKTFGSTPTNGNTIYAFLVSNSATVSSLTQTNVTWTRVAKTANGGGNQGTCEVWQGAVAASAGTVVTVNFSTNNVQAVIFQEWSGLTTPDAAQSHLVIFNAQWTQEDVTLAFPALGGRAFLLVQNSTGGAIATPAGWTASTGSPFNYGGSGEGALYSMDCSSGSGKNAAWAHIVPVNTDHHLATLVHCVP